MPKLLFVDNGNNIYTYAAIAKAMTSEIQCAILVFSKQKKKFLDDQGIANYMLSGNVSKDINHEVIRRKIEAIEHQFPDYRFLKSIQNDRVLKFFPTKIAQRKLVSFLCGFMEVIEKFQPTHVIGEISWAVEHLFYYFCRQKYISYRCLLNLPTQGFRLAFFDDHHSMKSVIESAFINDEETKDDTPGGGYYELSKLVKNRKPSLSFIIRNFRYMVSFQDYRLHPLVKLRRISIQFYRPLYKVFEALISIKLENLPKDKKYLFYPLHVQPESTPDFVAPFDNDQFLLAEQLKNSLPGDMVLLIKDHPNIFSVRSCLKLLRLVWSGKAFLLKRNESSREVMKRSDLCATIAGTAAFEAAQIAKPCLLFSDIFHLHLPNTIDAREYKTLSHAIAHALSIKKEGKLEPVPVDYFDQFGAKGFIHDITVVPAVVEPENLQRLCLAVRKHVFQS